MVKLSLIVLVILITIAAFYGGMRWQKGHIGELRKWRLAEPMELQESPERRGSLPAGTVLYEYRVLPETSTYIVFVSTERRDVLQEYELEDGRSNVIDPLSGYLSEEGGGSE